MLATRVGATEGPEAEPRRKHGVRNYHWRSGVTPPEVPHAQAPPGKRY